MLGNMVLLKASLNHDLGNASFNEKQKVFEASAYSITNGVAEYDQWTMNEIRDRQAKIAKIATKTWTLSFAD
jgi:hypothetical protein